MKKCEETYPLNIHSFLWLMGLRFKFRFLCKLGFHNYMLYLKHIRKPPRIKAKETFTLEEFKKSMEGIYTTSVAIETIDEAPFVYKPMQEIIDNIQDTVEIKKIIRPIYNFKAKN